MKKIFVVYSIEQDGKRYAIADTIRTGENLIPIIKRYNTDICHLCESRQQAEQIAIEWNESYKANCTYVLNKKSPKLGLFLFGVPITPPNHKRGLKIDFNDIVGDFEP